MTTKHRARLTTIVKAGDSIWVYAGNAVLWKRTTNNEYGLLHVQQGRAIKLTADELADIAQAIDAMTKEQDGEL